MPNWKKVIVSGSDAILSNITASNNISASGYASASYFIGDGSQLTNLPSQNPFPFTGSATILGSLDVTGDITASGNISATSMSVDTIFGYNQHGEYTNNIRTGNLIAATNNTFHIGDYQNFYANIFSNQISTNGLTTIGSGTEIELAANVLIPNVDKGPDLGTAAKRYGEVHSGQIVTTNITASGNISASGGITASGFLGEFTGNLTGNADTATILATSRNINGVSFNGSSAITVPAAGSTLTDTVPISKGGTNLTSLGSALQVLRVNAAGNGLEYSTSTVGDITSVLGGTGITVTDSSGPSPSVAIDSTVVTLTGTQTLTNKTLTAPVLSGISTTTSGNLQLAPATAILEVRGVGSTDAAIRLNCYVNSHGQTLKAQPHSESVTNTMFLPKGSNSTLVSEVSTSTLTNKNLTGASNTFPTFNQNTTGNAATATILATARNINGVSFNGSAAITITAAGSTLSDTVPISKGGTNLTSVGTAGQILSVNGAGNALEYITPTVGDITAIETTTSDQITITNGNGPVPSLAITTAAIANAGTGLATADQIHTFVTTQTDTTAADTSGNAATSTKIASITNSNIVQLTSTQALTNKNLTGAGNTFPTFNQNTTGTAAGLSSTLVVGSGGTGLTALGSANQVLTVNGAGNALEYTTPTTGTVTSVTGTTAITSSGGNTPNISIPAADDSTNGFLTMADWTTFNSKGSGDVTGVTSATTNQITVANSTGPEPSISAVTATVADGGTGLATADQIHTFVTTQTDAMAANTSGTAASLSSTLITGRGGTGLTALGSANQVLTVNGAGNALEYTTPTTGTVTNVTSANTNTITVANGTSTPAITAVTGAVNSSSTNLATGTQIQTAIDTALSSALIFRGAYNANTNSPVLDSRGSQIAVSIGDTYVVSVAGTFYGEVVTAGETLIAQANASAGTGAITDWALIQENIGLATTSTAGIASFPSPFTVNAGAVTMGAADATTNGIGRVTNSDGSITVTYSGGNAVLTAAGSNTVTSVTGTSPIVSSGGTTPAISIPEADDSTNGYLTSTDWSTFNSKGSGDVTEVTSATTDQITVANSTGPNPAISAVTATIANAGTGLATADQIHTFVTTQTDTTAANTSGTAASLSSTLITGRGGTGLTSIGSALQVLRVNAAGNGLEYATSTVGDITEVQSSTTNQLVVTNGAGPIPSLAITTAAIANAGTGLATADQIHTFVTTQTDATAANTSGNAATSTKISSITNSNIVQLTSTQTLTNKNLTGAGNTFPTFNQNTTGNAATSTILATARNINGVSFNGSAAITVPAAGSTLTDTVTVAKGGTNLTSLGSALQVLRVNAAGNGLEYTTPTTGDVTEVTSATADQITVANSTGPNPAISAVTGTIANGEASLATADQIHTFVTTQTDATAADTSGNAATATNVAYSGLTGTVPTWNQNTSGTAASLSSTLITGRGGTGLASLGSALQVLRVNAAGNGLEYATSTTGDITGVTAGTGLTGGGTSGNVTLNIDSTVATLTGTQTLTNKTLTSPTIGDTSNITFPTFNQNTTGNAATATTLATARNINGVSFNGSAAITITAAGSTLSDTVTVAKGGTNLTSLGSALQVLRVNAAGNALEYATSTVGDITEVQSSTTNQLVITNGAGPIPSLAITTAAIANAGTGLATADQIHTFVTTQTDETAADTSGNAATATILATTRTIAGVSFNGSANISLNNNAITNGAGFTTNTGTLTGNGTTNRVPIYNGTTSFTTDSGFTYASSVLNTEGLNISAPVNLSSEATSLMINGDGAVGTRELGSNAFNSTTIATNNNQLTNGAGFTTLALGTSGTTALAGNTTLGTVVAANPGVGVYDTLVRITIGGTGFNIPAGTGNGTVDTSGTPVDNDYAKFTDANTIEGRSTSEVKTDLSLNNVENKSSATIRGEIVSGNIPNNAADTSGNAATATTLATARTIAGVSFNGSANISLNNNAITNGAGYTTNAGTLTGNGTTNRVPIYSGTTTFTTDSGFTYASSVLNTEGLNISAPVNLSSEATSLMINGDGAVGTRELGSNAFNSTTIATNNNQLTNGAGFTTNTGTLTGNGTTNRVPIYNGTTSFTTDSGFTYASNILGTEGLNISALANLSEELTSLMINGDGAVGSRELGQNAFNSTTIPAVANGANNRVATFSGASALNGESTFTFDGTTAYVGGALGVGTTSPTTTGLIRATNDVIAFHSSDKRLKENITPITSALNKLDKINGVEFDWIPKEGIHENEGHDVGVIAQEIEKVIPEIVQTRDNGYKAVKYEKIVPLLIEAIKELKAEIEELKKSK